MRSIDSLSRSGTERLKAVGVPSPVRETYLILELSIAKPGSFVRAHPEYELTQQEINRFEEFIERRANHEPFQHISGNQEFYALSFEVNKHVLVPRPETELLVETALLLIENEKRPRIWDIGTGSGCIAVSILKNNLVATALATDISEDAIQVAKRNAAHHAVDRRMLCASVSTTKGIVEDRMFDLIVANPPYVPAADLDNLQKEVRDFDPHIALTDGSDGLSITREIVSRSPAFLNGSGHLALEFGFTQSNRVSEMFDPEIWHKPVLRTDLAGIPRIIYAQIKTI